MSKEDGTMYQHIVPRAHLKRFTDSDGNIWVYRKSGAVIKAYRRKPDKVGGKHNFYDSDPYDDNSTESFLRNVEGPGQKAIDAILCCYYASEVPDELKVYMVNLIQRTDSIRRSISNVFGDAGKSLSEDEMKELQSISMRDTTSWLTENGPDRMHCFIRCVVEPDFLITSDVPVTVIGQCHPESKDVIMKSNNPTSLEDLINREPSQAENEALKDFVYAMPITPQHCLFAVSGSNKRYEDIVPEPIDPFRVHIINSMMVNRCNEEIYADRDVKEYVNRIKLNRSHWSMTSDSYLLRRPHRKAVITVPSQRI